MPGCCRMPEDLAQQLRSCLAEVDAAITSTHPAPSSAFGKELDLLLKARRRSAAAASRDPAAAAAAQHNLPATDSAAKLDRAPLKEPAASSLGKQPQAIMSATAGPAACQHGTAPTTAASPPPPVKQQQARDQAAPLGGSAQCNAQLPANPDAGAGAEPQPPARSEAVDSWQLCPITKVGYPGAGLIHDLTYVNCIVCAHASSPSCFCRIFRLCPSVLQARMEDPVTGSDGICYERAALEGWVAKHGAVSPMTREAIGTDFVPNHTLRSLLQALQQHS
jgi:U-box domain